MTDKKFLDNAYGLEGAEETQAFYDAWSSSYDTEVAENGYATPARCAAALAQFAPDTSAPMLDLGCGTGVGGAALKAAGFTTIDGSDFSDEMMAQAGKKGIYRRLLKADLTNPMPFEAGDYTNISAIGVLNPGHAPAETLDAVLEMLPSGGCFVFSLNDHALADGTYEGRLREVVDCGTAHLLFSEYGEHLPKIDLKSTVYVLRKP